jgi:hypothetical protein
LLDGDSHVALDAHHDRGGGGRTQRELLGRGDAVQVGHVDVKQHDVNRLTAGELQRLCARSSAADDLDVRLEAEQLRDVVARFGDVVDDDDLDLVSHRYNGRR